MPFRRTFRLDYEDRTGRCRPLTVVTTLTDPALHDGIELHRLYARRWEPERSGDGPQDESN